MSIVFFEHIVKTEKRAKYFLRSLCWKNYRRFCPRCRGYRVYRFTGTTYRCKECRYDFHDFTGRWLNRLRISCRDWLWIVKLFELELSALKIAQQLELSYPTVLKAVTTIRLAILAHARDRDDFLLGEVEMDEAYFGGKRKGKRGRGAPSKVPVFGILEREGQVRVEVVKNVTAETLLGLTVKTVRRGSIVYTDEVLELRFPDVLRLPTLESRPLETVCLGQGLYQRHRRFLELRQRTFDQTPRHFEMEVPAVHQRDGISV